MELGYIRRHQHEKATGPENDLKVTGVPFLHLTININ
jgi:hypothetical protein